jgi:hypothetical protein
MIAYNKTWLQNLFIQEELDHSFDDKNISKGELENSKKLFPVGFYSPNFFVRIGLFLLTVVIVSMTMGLFALLSLDSIDKSIKGLLLFLSLACYGMLEFFVRSKNHFRSGIDDALMWLSAFGIVLSINLLYDDNFNVPMLFNSVLIFIISTFLWLRFLDTLMSVVSFCSLLAVVFFSCNKLGSVVVYLLPFLVAAICTATYFYIKKLKQKNSLTLYFHNFVSIEIVSLVLCYAALNFFIVSQLQGFLFGENNDPANKIKLAWLFWATTILIPPFYIFVGIKKRDSVILRIGLVLLGAIVFTIRYYKAVMPLENAMVFGGIILIAIAYFVTKYLSIPKNGITSKEIATQGKLQIESLIIAETFTNNTSSSTTEFGGGSGGGGGASGSY